MATGLAIAIAAIAALNWYSRRPASDTGDNSPWLEWFTKPTVTVGLIVLAGLVADVDAAQPRWFLVGLVLCLAGDVALMWRPERFRAGLILFLLAHVAFIVGFTTRATTAPSWSIAAGAATLAGCLAIGVRHLLPSVRRTTPRLFGPVLAYVMVIATMAVASWWGGHWAAPIGAATFAVSDLTLADDKFVAERRWSPVAVMITYHLALALLVISLT